MNDPDEDEDDEPPVRVYGMPDPQNRQPEPIQGMRGENAGRGDGSPEMRRRVTTEEGRSFDIVETSGRAAGEIVEAERRTREPADSRPAGGIRLSGLILAFGAGIGLAALVQTTRRAY